MGQNLSKATEKSISERLSEILPKLSRNQTRFVVAMQECTSKKEAAEAVDLQPDTVYRWPAYVEEAADLVALNVAASAQAILKRHALKASMVKVAGLDSEDEKIRHDVASEVLDRILGRPTQRTELTGEDGGPIQVADARHSFMAAIESEVDAGTTADQDADS